jgi:hypothetical protein
MDVTEAGNATNETRYVDVLVTMSADPAASAEVSGGYFRVNRSAGSNGVYTINGLEGVAGSSYADEAGTFRGVYGRTYTNADATSTMRTAIGGEFSARASFNGGTACVAESGTAFVGSRIWMAPYFTAGSVGNLNNFWGLWIYGEHATQRNADAAIKISDAGGGFTDDIILQTGNSITNGSANVITTDAGLTIGDATTDVTTLNGSITSDQALTAAATQFYLRSSNTVTSGTFNNLRARAQSTAAGASTAEFRGVYGQAVTNASLYGGTGTGVFANFIGKNASTTVTGRALFAEAETEATASALTNLYAGYFRTKVHLSPTTDYYGIMIDNEKMATGYTADAYIGLKSTTWGAGVTSATYGIDMNAVTGLGTADIRGHEGEIIFNDPDGTWDFGAANLTTTGKITAGADIQVTDQVDIIDGTDTFTLKVASDALSIIDDNASAFVVFSVDSSGTVRFSPGTQNYDWGTRTAGGGDLSLQSQTSAASHTLLLMSKDGDATDNVQLGLVGRGTPTQYTNRERLMMRWNSAASTYDIVSDNAGSGTLRPIKIFTDGSNQIEADEDGTLHLGENTTTLKAFNFFTDTSSVDDSYGFVDADIAAYTTGMVLFVSIQVANTGACTLQISSLGAKAIKMLNDQDPGNNYFEVGSIALLVYDGTNFQVLSPAAN